MRMGKINAFIDNALFYFSASCLCGIVVICLVQVVARYMFSASFAWAEEISIIILLWAAWVAACLAVKEDGHLRMRILEERISEKANLVIRCIIKGLSITLLVVVFFSSRIVLDSMAFMSLMTLPSVPMTVKYGSVTAGSLLLSYYLLRSMISDLLQLRSTEGKET